VPGVIRPCAFCFVREGEHVLVGRYREPSETFFFRPLGGGIHFGESGEEAVRREMREELGLEVRAITFLGFLENIFEWNSEAYHELCLIYAAEPDGWALDRLDGFAVPESMGNETAVVFNRREIARLSRLYPDGVSLLVEEL
jgi:ADP-ribose pyrophosphatase YjhB (NUDIX family)